MAPLTKLSSVLILSVLAVLTVYGQYQPTWESLDARPLPAWYDEAKFGIFIHWGVFSVPSIGNEWFWYLWQRQKLPEVVDYMKNNFRPGWTYADFAPMFTAEFFDADEWARLLESSGAKYTVFVSKHCEGFCHWPTNVSFSWNSMAAGPKRNIVGELEKAIRGKTNLRFGLYHVLYEWFHPLYVQDKANNFTTRRFVDFKITPALYELVNTYKPDIVWSDGDAEASASYWGSREFLAWLYNDSPVKDVVVTNDRWCTDCKCNHGGVYTCGDRYNPGVLQKHKWVNAMTIDKKSWGFRRNAPLSDYLTIEELVETLAKTVSCNGNMLMNIGPTHYGVISPIYEERLRQMGQWLKVNGEAIYSSRPWTYQNETSPPELWYTSKKSSEGTDVYAIILSWPTEGVITLHRPAPDPANTVVTLLGYSSGAFEWTSAGPTGGISITIPVIPANKMPCKWAWVFKITNVKN
ncbi:alpha-L-fucosidase-like [Haliotis cracherodii]|uniref:alpha-L-fucosidase-like n=1 Tax=Haliotis cracherodii TaxID=6455 RepID=UPI0039E8B67E